jgi:tripartite-type tricarboxylate transporter receptor subunit TctC
MPQRRPLLLAVPGLALGRGVAAQPSWPQRPVRIVVPFGLGGSADVAARLLAEPLAAAFGQPFIVENRPGAGATIGTDQWRRPYPMAIRCC